jgi:hypothetical protein
MNYEHTIVRLRGLQEEGKALRDLPYPNEIGMEAWRGKVLIALEDRPDLQDKFFHDPPMSFARLIRGTHRPPHYWRMKDRIEQISAIIGVLYGERFPTYRASVPITGSQGAVKVQAAPLTVPQPIPSPAPAPSPQAARTPDPNRKSLVQQLLEASGKAPRKRSPWQWISDNATPLNVVITALILVASIAGVIVAYSH